MESAKKSHLVIGIIAGVIFVAVVSFSTYYFLTQGTTKETAQSPKIETTKTKEDNDLDTVKSELNNAEKELDTTDLDKDLNELNSIDLSGV